jgi:hypothetical protein
LRSERRRVDCESTSCPVGGEKREKVSSVGPGGFKSMNEYEPLPEEDKKQIRELNRKRGKTNQYRS